MIDCSSSPPDARSRTRAMKSRTTWKLTSASSSAIPHLPQRDVEVVLADAPARAEAAEGGLKAFAEGL